MGASPHEELLYLRAEVTALRELIEAHERVAAEQSERADRALEQLRLQAAELTRSNEELEQFAFSAAHDLQDPLRKIQSFSWLLGEEHKGALPPEARQYLDRIQHAGRRMQHLIDDLLHYSRVAGARVTLRPVNLGKLVDEVVQDLEARIEQTGGRVQGGRLPAPVADPRQMRQLFQNLIGNGLKYHRPDVPPVVHVRTGEAPPDGPAACCVVVEDNGIGFPADRHDEIFAPFRRLHGRGQYEGTGLGLAICRKIVHNHGGTLAAEGWPGKGARFTVVLPCRPAKGGASDG